VQAPAKTFGTSKFMNFPNFYGGFMLKFKTDGSRNQILLFPEAINKHYIDFL